LIDLRVHARRLGTIVAIALAVSAIHAAGLLEFVERPLQNLRFRVVSRRASGNVVLVAIDSKSLRALGGWPYSEKRYAAAVESLVHAGARRIALAVTLPSGSSPAEGRVLAEALEQAKPAVVVSAVHAPDDDAVPGEREPEFLPPASLGSRSVMASADLLRDDDGLVRRYAPQGVFSGTTTPSLAAAMSDGMPLSRDEFYLDLGIDPNSIPRVSFADVLSGQYDPAVVAGKTVLVGLTAPEVTSAVAMPTGRSLPPVVVHALAVESLFRGRALSRTGFAVSFLIALPLALLFWRRPAWISSRRGFFAVITAFVGCFVLSVLIQSVFPVVLDISPWILAMVGLVIVAEAPPIDGDDSKLHRGSTRIDRAEQLMRQVVDNNFDAVIQASGDGTIEILNEAAQRMFGYSSSEAIGRFVGELVRAGEVSLTSKPTVDAFLPSPRTREAIGIRRDGSRFPVEVRVGELDGDGRRRRVGTLRDLTDRRAHERALEHQARHDTLTGLPNRVMLREQVVRALNQAQRDGSQVAFLILDLDRFKEVNDTLGHHVGDMLLQHIGARLQSELRQSDTIARMGGDEFAVLLPGTDAETARDIARRLVASLAQPFDTQGLPLQIEASIGIAMFPEDGKDASDVIQRADVAMYVAKRERTGFAVYELGRDFNSVRHLTLNGELRKAIDEDHLVLYYQPKVSAKDGKIVGAEALVRWQHALFGMIPPDDFIALAEHSGLIKPLTRWVLNEAMRQAAEWRRNGLPLPVAVNVSARNLLEKGMPEEVSRLLESHGLPPELLVCEITESVIMEDRRRSLEAIMALVGMGVTIAIDDFGTGYSSLAYLRQLPAAEIKIDKSFVMNMDRDKDDAVIVGSTIQMAHSLGLKVVAEGVESERIWCELVARGCDYGQGYYFSRPVPAGMFIDLLRASAEVGAFLPLIRQTSSAQEDPTGALR
jgi:diguanylate cyclase (GGDEF)-like protein/PAS domain S-box-containing protein